MRASDPSKAYMTVGEISRLVGCSSKTVCKWIDSGLLEGYRLPGSKDRRVSRVIFSDFARDNDLMKAVDDNRRGMSYNSMMFTTDLALIGGLKELMPDDSIDFPDSLFNCGYLLGSIKYAVVIIDDITGDEGIVLYRYVRACNKVVVLGSEDQRYAGLDCDKLKKPVDLPGLVKLIRSCYRKNRS